MCSQRRSATPAVTVALAVLLIAFRGGLPASGETAGIDRVMEDLQGGQGWGNAQGLTAGTVDDDTPLLSSLQGKKMDYGEPRQLGIITDENIAESSGLASAPLTPGTFWTHNDSGDTPRLFLIDRKGQTRATLTVQEAQATDWEDMASFKDRRHGYLLIGDVGDNDAKREQYTLYIIREPRI